MHEHLGEMTNGFQERPSVHRSRQRLRDGRTLASIDIPHESPSSLALQGRDFLAPKEACDRCVELRVLLDVLGQAVFGLDRKGLVVLSSSQAAAIVARADGLQIVEGRLAAKSTNENAVLNASIAKTIELPSGAGGLQCRYLTLSCCSETAETAPLHLTLVPIAIRCQTDCRRLAVLVIVTDLAQEPVPRTAPLCSLYGLSPVEAQIADMLLRGFEINEIARRRRITEGTARFHVKRVLAKTGTRRQSELIRLMLAIPGTSASVDAGL